MIDPLGAACAKRLDNNTQRDTRRDTDTHRHTHLKQNVQRVSVAAQDSLALAEHVGTYRSKSQTLEHVARWQPRNVST